MVHLMQRRIRGCGTESCASKGGAMPLVLHFLNVGHGDCTFIELPSGRLMMIDINNSKSLPDTDKLALAAAKGVSALEFAGAGLRLGSRSWQQYYESLLVDPYDYSQDHFRSRSI